MKQDPLLPASPASDAVVDASVQLSSTMRVATLIAVILPFAGLIFAIASLWGWGLSWIELTLLCGLYLVSALGITVGYHRLFTHRSFETNRVVKCALAIMGSMAVQGPLLKWVALHRRHHQHSDKEEDPHSPHLHGRGLSGLVRGLWFAHVGWLFKPEAANLARYVKDLRQSRSLSCISNLFPLWVLCSLLLPTLLGLLFLGGWKGALMGLVWGGLVRIFFVHHVTWSVNSICHIWGHQPYASGDESKNNFLVGLLAMGEGWHNNHHAFPTSARHGLRWWQIDVSYWFICLLSLCRLAWNVKSPDTPDAVALR